MIKMVVSDMDGTLLHSDMSLSERNKEAIKKLKKQGIHFTIATGRPEQLLKEYMLDLQHMEPVIMYNGSVIGHPFQQQRILDLRLDPNDVREIVDYCEEHDVIYMLYTQTRLISKDNYRVQEFLERNKTLPDNAHCIFEVIESKQDISTFDEINKVLIIEHDPTKRKMVQDMLKGHDKFTVASSQKAFVDINPLGANKGNALEVLADYYGLALQDIIVFGDQDNDESMLLKAGTSVAMSNASDKARRAASHHALSNNEDGFAVWVEEHILK